jgi:DNA processing protein
VTPPDHNPAAGHPDVQAMLRLTLTPGLGPVLIARLVKEFGTPDAVLGLSASQLERVKGIGSGKSGKIAAGLAQSAALVQAELDAAGKAGARLVVLGGPGYPALLATIPDPPPLLYVQGRFDPTGDDRFPVAIVGSRACSPYGIEQAERFAGIFARAGLTVVSGGARGIDTAAHRGAVRSSGRTVVVTGCGLGHCYPPENLDLFRKVVDLGGTLVSELPMSVAPTPENFPPRNRIISGMSLGVVVIEAAVGSGALITAKTAVEDQNRDVFAVPGRVDSPTSRGTHELLKTGGALLVTDPGDVIAGLEIQATHVHEGTFDARYSAHAPEPDDLFTSGSAPPTCTDPILAALDAPRTLDQIIAATGIPVGEVRGRLTMLELQKRVRRRGASFERA